jgi:hypothetical protein
VFGSSRKKHQTTNKHANNQANIEALKRAFAAPSAEHPFEAPLKELVAA